MSLIGSECSRIVEKDPNLRIVLCRHFAAPTLARRTWKIRRPLVFIVASGGGGGVYNQTSELML